MRTLIIVASLMTASLGASADEVALIPPSDRVPAVDFSVLDLGGDSHTLSALAGRVVAVSFWATWCVPCLEELPFMQGFNDEFGAAGLTVLAVSTDGPESVAQVAPVVRRARWTMPILLDSDSAARGSLNPENSNPHTVFVDRLGRVAYVHTGFSSGDEVAYRAVIEALLAE